MPSRPSKLETVITYLEMTAPPCAPPPAPPADAHAIMLAKPISVSYYRYLYNTVGEDNLWWERRALADRELGAIVQSEAVDVFVLYIRGVPAGFFELFQAPESDTIELAYFGLMPDFIGRGLGGYLLRTALDEAWQRGPVTVTVNTCTLDHPSALPVYQKAGFQPIGQEKRTVDDPRETGLISANDHKPT